MSNNVKLSPTHGVNPSIPICFWCGKEKNQVALLGKIDKKDSEAPKRIIMDYEPCNECKELFSKGIQVIGVSEKPIMENMFPIMVQEDKEFFPTGAMFLSSKEWTKAFLEENNPEMVDMVMEKQVMLMDNEIVEELIKQYQEVEQAEENIDEDN